MMICGRDVVAMSGPLPRHMDKPLQKEMQNKWGRSPVVLLEGATGVGKSRRGPIAALMSQMEAKGVFHIMQHYLILITPVFVRMASPAYEPGR